MSTVRGAYATYKYLISLAGIPVGGFAEVSGLDSSLAISLKRGLAGSVALFDWLKAARDGRIDRRQVTITLVDDARRPIKTWDLRNALPKKWVGPTLDARGSDVPMEEIQLSCEGIETK